MDSHLHNWLVSALAGGGVLMAALVAAAVLASPARAQDTYGGEAYDVIRDRINSDANPFNDIPAGYDPKDGRTGPVDNTPAGAGGGASSGRGQWEGLPGDQTPIYCSGTQTNLRYSCTHYRPGERRPHGSGDLCTVGNRIHSRDADGNELPPGAPVGEPVADGAVPACSYLPDITPFGAFGATGIGGGGSAVL